jgi:GxxExxY protein
LKQELHSRGLSAVRQVAVPIVWEGVHFIEGFRADLIVNDLVIVELKSIERLAPVHSKQVLTYLRLMGLRLGLLVNFGEELIKTGIRRVVNGLPDQPRGNVAEPSAFAGPAQLARTSQVL